ncbi:MAG: site-2 protease family protein [Acidilobus sp.]|jgi:membrane-associated protease RseP (regulator of RpoE activity)
MSYLGLTAAATAFVAAWLLVYILLRRRSVKGLTLYPFLLIYRLGYARGPLPPGAKAKLAKVYGVASLAAAAFAMAYFYFVSGSLFLQRYVVGSSQAAQEGFVPIIPGVTVSLGEFMFILIAIGVAVVVHELSHAVVSRALGVPVKDAGFLLMAFVPAAFVEPEEGLLKSAPLRSRVMIYAAGIASNVALGFLFGYALAAVTPLLASGMTIVSVSPNSPAYAAGLAPGMKIAAIDGIPVRTLTQGLQVLKSVGAESNATAVNVTLTVLYRGVERSIAVFKPVGVSHLGIEVTPVYKMGWLVELITALYVVNMGLALINAAPFAFPLPGFGIESDGGQMLRDALTGLAGKAGRDASAAVELATLLLILSLITLAPVRLP